MLFIVVLPWAIYMKPNQIALDRRSSSSPPAVVDGEGLAFGDELTKLARLHSDGSLTDEEFKELKAKVIGAGRARS